jgi:hypothetical protein
MAMETLEGRESRSCQQEMGTTLVVTCLAWLKACGGVPLRHLPSMDMWSRRYTRRSASTKSESQQQGGVGGGDGAVAVAGGGGGVCVCVWGGVKGASLFVIELLRTT